MTDRTQSALTLLKSVTIPTVIMLLVYGAWEARGIVDRVSAVESQQAKTAAILDSVLVQMQELKSRGKS